ncbi:atrial natriuretic peptide receptor 1-like [Pocillopora damicornis]|uniref:atrial natriuretic peptide receptor 1-like n=1 Tax=Pocillopora damicornis TaxID=46731 RepID=UPI000F5532F1|nr:atrial natriuretic peptide receptor 1-like [Pocillopora damicornis]
MNFWAQQKRGVDAFIGGGCNRVCEYISLLAGKWNLPVISWGCMSAHLSNRNTFPTFVRTVGPYTKMEKLLKRLMEHFNWKRVAIIASTDDIWQIAANLVKIELLKHKINVAHFHSFIPGRLHILESRIVRHADLIRRAAKRAMIFILLCDGGDIREIMLNFLDLGLLNGNYAFITVHLPKRSYIGNNTWMGNDGRDNDAKKAYEGVLNIEQKFGTEKRSGAKVSAFVDRIKKRMKQEPFNVDFPENRTVEAYAGTMYDAVWLYALAVNETLEMGTSIRNGLEVAKRTYNRLYEGIAGPVYMDRNGERDPDYVIQTLIDDRFEDIAYYTRYNDNFTIREGVTIVWPGGVTTAPNDSPECGWDGELCLTDSQDSTTYIIIACCTVFGFVFVTMVFVFVYRKLIFELDLAQNQTWKVKLEDIVFRDTVNLFETSNMNLGSLRSMKSQLIVTRPSRLSSVGSTKSCASLKSADTQCSARWSLHEQVFSSGFTNIAFNKGELVVVKHTKKKDLRISRKILIEVKQARELRHENINPFIGICIDSPQVMILSKYLKRGSLQDLLENEDFKLEEIFILSLVRDVATGMMVLHNSPVQVHGRLKSSNCLIDSRWVCKIGDWGLSELRSPLDRCQLQEGSEKYNDMLWCAPEHISDGEMDHRGSQKGDVYSYGIILQEIAIRKPPYSMYTFEPQEIIARVMAHEDPPFRPVVEENACKSELQSLMTQCWDDDPDRRPHFNKILDRLRKVMGRDVNIMDNIMALIERHAENLEALVEERTLLLMEEKKKTDKLLYKMLPVAVAEQLKLGKPVTPEYFDEVTIYFSEIMAFIDLASESTPMEIVAFLNDLYLALDNILGNYDVFKVETIGDCLLVVSGLPVRNGNRHAGEIADMAFDILSLMTHFKIRHRPRMKLQLRVGLHSGSCVAGVVGIHMPRFCLFGDTVNVASRVETTGQALKIHVSEDCYRLLKEIGGYTFLKRGEVYLKGRGFWKTYWLIGKEGFNKPLPHAMTANSEPSVETLNIYYAS